MASAAPLDWLPAGRLAVAEERAAQYIDLDPFPHIPKALLAGDHIVAYAREIAMIYPAFGISKEKGKSPRSVKGALKTASYETNPGNRVIRYNEKGELEQAELDSHKNEFIVLPANSITFVTTKDRFFLPNYIAMRFNLRIKHVHRGILLGTGPLVDPGYNHEILIPLHNLTSDDYHIALDEGLIWVEFTKTSALLEIDSSSSTPSSLAPPDIDRDLPPNTKKSIEEFIYKANLGWPIRSSIPRAILEAEKSAERAASQATTLRNVGLVALVALTIGLIGVFISMLTLISATQSTLRDTQNKMVEIERRLPPE